MANKIEFSIEARDNAAKALDKINSSFDNIEQSVKGFSGSAKAADSAVSSLNSANSQLSSTVKVVDSSFDNLNASTVANVAAIDDLSDVTKDVGQQADKTGKQVDDLSEDYKENKKAANDSERTTASYIDILKKMGDTVKTAVLAVTGATAAVVAFTAATASAVRESELMADVAGLSINEFNRMAHAANAVGVSNEQLSDQLKDVNDKVADFLNTGGGPMADFFENIAPKVGVTAEQFKNLSSKDALQLYVSSLEEANASQADMTFYMEAIANDATKLIPLLSNQGAAMKQAANDAEFLGITMSESLIKKSGDFKQGMDRAKKSIKGASLAIGENLMPIITELSNRFANFTAENRKQMSEFTKSTVGAMFGVVDATKTFVDNFSKILGGIKFIFRDIINNIMVFGLNMVKAMGETFMFLPKALWSAFERMSQIVGDFGGWFTDKIKSIFTGGDVQNFGEMMRESLSNGLNGFQNDVTTAFYDINDAMVASVDEMGPIFDPLGTSLSDAFQGGIDKANELMQVVVENNELISESNNNVHESNATNLETMDKQWKKFYKGVSTVNKQSAAMFLNLMNKTIDGFSKAFAQAIVQGRSLTDLLKSFTQEILTELVSMFIKLGIQHLIQTKLMATSSGSKIGAEVYGNAFASTAAIPIIGPSLAPGVAAASLAAATAGMAASASAGAGAAAGALHGGMDSVPKEATYLLDKGERVLSPNQNKDFTDFLSNFKSSEMIPASKEVMTNVLTPFSANSEAFNDIPVESGGGSTSIKSDTVEQNFETSIVIENVNIEILPNATNADALLELDPNDMKEIVAGPIIDALNALDNEGVRPNFIERQAV